MLVGSLCGNREGLGIRRRALKSVDEDVSDCAVEAADPRYFGRKRRSSDEATDRYGGAVKAAILSKARLI